MNSPEATIQFAGHALILHAHGIIYWPGERTLIASDLHFEKSTYLAKAGSFIPPYDTLDTLVRLEEMVARYQPQRLILLGDSFHDSQAWGRLSEALRARIANLAASVAQCIWIEGNHDVGLHSHPLGALTGSVTIGGIHFAHDDSVAERPVIIGHYHPKTRVNVGKRIASGKCFIHSAKLLIMPSFGSYTGGLDVKHAAIRSLFVEESPQLHLIYRSGIYRVQH